MLLGVGHTGRSVRRRPSAFLKRAVCGPYVACTYGKINLGYIANVDIPGAIMQADMDDIVNMNIQRENCGYADQN